jgi:hypothetical protein
MIKIILLALMPILCLAQKNIVIVDMFFDIEEIQKNSNVSVFIGIGDYFNNPNTHGTDIVKVISNNLSKERYSLSLIATENTLNKYELALQSASQFKNSIILLPWQGYYYYENELKSLRKMIEGGNTVVISAGNHGINLDINCNIYPACYKKTLKELIVIGSTGSYSNRGKIVDEYLDPGISKGSSFSIPVKAIKLIKGD